MISCSTNSTQVALALAAPLIIPLLLFGGFFLQNGAVPVYFDWMRYISWFMYGNEALSINQWTGVTFDDEACSGGTCTGEAILARFGFNPVRKIAVGILQPCNVILVAFRTSFIAILVDYSL